MKLCDNNGKWFRKGRGSEWTNYSTCSAVERIQKKSAVHMAAYAISMILLFPALLIFALYKLEFFLIYLPISSFLCFSLFNHCF